MLEISDLKVEYGKKEILHGVSLRLEKGKILALVGESGSGKSTLLRSVIGLLGKDGAISAGSIMLDDQQLNSKKTAWREIRGSRIGMIFQNPEGSMDPVIPIGKQIYESLCVDGRISRRSSDMKALEAFEKLGLPDGEHILRSYPFELSGGMCQRVAIAMAMLRNPQILLADEPTSALDVASQLQTIETLSKMRELQNTAILMVTHNLGVAANLADEIGVMQGGKLIEQGSTEQILHNPQMPYTQMLLASVPKI